MRATQNYLTTMGNEVTNVILGFPPEFGVAVGVGNGVFVRVAVAVGVGVFVKVGVGVGTLALGTASRAAGSPNSVNMSTESG